MDTLTQVLCNNARKRCVAVDVLDMRNKWIIISSIVIILILGGVIFVWYYLDNRIPWLKTGVTIVLGIIIGIVILMILDTHNRFLSVGTRRVSESLSE